MTTIDILFIHHSVGRGILRHGDVRRRLRRLPDGDTVRLWDHDYNWRGVRGPDGQRHGLALPIPGDDTTPKGLLRLLHTGAPGPLVTQRIAPFQAIIIKSCFPNSRIASDADFATLKSTYRHIVERLHGAGVVSGILTTPPVRAGRIPADQAARAADLAAWLVRESGFDLTFDLFAALADADPSSPTYGMLRSENANLIPIDSHPTRRASRTLGEPVALFIRDLAAVVRKRDPVAGGQ